MTQSEIIFMVVAPHIHFCTQYHSGMLINNMATMVPQSIQHWQDTT